MFGVKEREIRLDLFLISDPKKKPPLPEANSFPQICGFCVRTERPLMGCRRIRYAKRFRSLPEVAWLPCLSSP